MVHFPALSSLAYVFSQGCPGIDRGGFPHSEISGSTPVCGSPKLFAACHVLHRLLAPRHPPYALSSLTFNPRNRCRRRLPTGRTRTKTPTPPEHFDTLRVVWSEKLPFAGYSVVKEPPSPVAISPRGATGTKTAEEPPPGFPGQKRSWWRIPGSNRRPPGCKPGALPAELIPPPTTGPSERDLQPRRAARRQSLVGLGRFELPTPRLSSVCSNQLSYRPSAEDDAAASRLHESKRSGPVHRRFSQN